MYICAIWFAHTCAHKLTASCLFALCYMLTFCFSAAVFWTHCGHLWTLSSITVSVVVCELNFNWIQWNCELNASDCSGDRNNNINIAFRLSHNVERTINPLYCLSLALNVNATCFAFALHRHNSETYNNKKSKNWRKMFLINFNWMMTRTINIRRSLKVVSLRSFHSDGRIFVLTLHNVFF